MSHYIAWDGQMIDELGMILKEDVVVSSRHFSGISVERLRKTTRVLTHDSLCPDRGFEPSTSRILM
jgi:hypothetical protein